MKSVTIYQNRGFIEEMYLYTNRFCVVSRMNSPNFAHTLRYASSTRIIRNVDENPESDFRVILIYCPECNDLRMCVKLPLLYLDLGFKFMAAFPCLSCLLSVVWNNMN